MSFTVITTVLNNEKFILNCLQSVKKQKFKKSKVEHIIIDGGSTDKTTDIIKKFKKKNKYVKFFYKKNSSIYDAINFAIKKSKNTYVGLLHSDDYYFDTNILNIVENNFKLDQNIKAIYANVKLVSRFNKNKIIRYFKSKQLKKSDFLKCDHPPHTSLFVNKDVFINYGNYNLKFKIASDFEFMLRVLGVNQVKSKYINRTFVVMRSGGTSTKSLKNIIISNYEVFKSFKENNLKINLIYIFIKILRKILQLRLFN
jgi:glycosyltransferase involved in cell wall biosynthesis